MDYFAIDGLSYERIVEVKREFDKINHFPYKYWVTPTWIENPTWTYGISGVEFEQRREQQVNGYYISLARFTKSHLQVYSVISRPHLNTHFHTTIASEKPIPASTFSHKWREGNIHIRKYDPLYGERNYMDPDRNCIRYMYGKWEEHRILKVGAVYCPGVHKSCRKGRCKYRKEDYKRKSLVKTTT